VSPPWFWERTCTGASAIVRQTADRRVGGRRCNRGSVTTGAYAPPLLFVRRSPAGGIATFAMHKRTRTKSGGRQPAVRLRIAWPARLRTYSGSSSRSALGAAGVSPPWDGKRTCKGASVIARQTAAGVLADAVAIAFV